jgi:hypothetical protein
MPKLGDAALPRPGVAEQLNDDGVFNVGFPNQESVADADGTSRRSERSQRTPSSSRTGWVPNDVNATRPRASLPDE